MISEVHYTDETLIAMLESGDEDAISHNQHLASCQTCRDGLEQYRAIVNILGREAARDYCDLKDEPEPATVAALRAFATNMQREDDEAETYVAALLDGSRETWMPRLNAHPEWRTAGVVRKLVADAYGALTRMPLDGVEMTSLAIEIADHLVEETYPKDTVARVRGHAWREHAYGLFYVGEFKKSLVACDRADAELSRCVVDEYDKARVAVVRALSLRPLDEIAPARENVLFAARAFQLFGDTSRVFKAALAAVHMDFKVHDYEAAFRRLFGLFTETWPELDNESRYALAGNLGFCCCELGRFDDAIEYYDRARACLGTKSNAESTRLQWHVATLLVRSGRLSDAVEELSRLREEFDRLEMRAESMLVSLEMAEVLLIEGRATVAEALCRELCSRIELAGLSSTSRAMTAVAYLQEALSLRKATPTLVRHVRNYVERLPEQPNLLFAPLPL